MPEVPVQDKQNIFVTLKNAIRDLLQNKVTRYSTLAASFRFVAMFAFDYFGPAFFLMNYPNHRKQFSILYCCMVASGGLISSISGGVLADKFGPKYPKAYSRICIVGSILAAPTVIAAVLIQNNFYLAMGLLYLDFLIGECFWSPNITMI